MAALLNYRQASGSDLIELYMYIADCAFHIQIQYPFTPRILYGRRRSSASRSSHSHASRRNVISRFLSSNGQAEITEFLTLLMSPFTNSTRLNSSMF